jgi:peptidyl-prolyl cis-trans isomerase C
MMFSHSAARSSTSVAAKLLFALATSALAAPSLVLAQKLPPDPKTVIVAERGGQQVTLHEIDAQVMAMPRHLRPSFLDNPERLEEVISGILINKQLAARVDRAQLEKDPHYAAQLQLATEELLARRARYEFENRLMADQPDFDVLAEEIFRTHPHRFRRPVTLELRHILVRIGGRGEAAARARAEEARAALIAGEQDFREIFMTYSDEAADPRGLSNGILENIIPGVTEKPFEEVVFQLTEPGQVSELIKTPYGIHVTQLVKRAEPTQKTFEEVRQQLVTEQRDKFFNDRRAAFLSEMRDLPVDAKPLVVAQLRSRYAQADQDTLPPALDGTEESAEADQAEQGATRAVDAGNRADD